MSTTVPDTATAPRHSGCAPAELAAGHLATRIVLAFQRG
jgi:hypothetical protein